MTLAHDRRVDWTPPPRPEWLTNFNALGPLLDTRGIVPLDEESLTRQASLNTGLTDFGDEDGWRQHFRVLLDSIESEAKLNFFGRIQTRAEMLVDLEARLRVVDAFKRFPEIADEQIVEPIFIVGLGRSGTTILQETLSQDPQFRSVARWEGQFPWPPPEEATYHSDPRIRLAQNLVDVTHAVQPEWRAMHAWGGDLPIEDIEFTHSCFLSEVWPLAFQIPSYERYFESEDVTPHFRWHQKMLQLLQWKLKRKHWLLKNPTHLPRLPQLLETYPDAKFIFPHRDPIVSGDSVTNVMGAIYYRRTDEPFAGGVIDEHIMAAGRAEQWDRVIEWIESGVLRPGSFTNVVYADFKKDPLATLKRAYRELGLEADRQTFDRMMRFLEERDRGDHGNRSVYAKTGAETDTAKHERRLYERYQSYFNVPSEI